MKVKRHNKILEIIENYNIETQEELIAKLKLAGFDVTQATVSRDIRELKLLKQMSDMGTYKYVIPKSNSNENQHVYTRTLSHSIKSVDSAYNDIVIKTYPGMAQAVAAGIDSLHETDILGCVAGDDCIIIVTRSPECAVAISHRISKLMNS
ncbi:MAG: arginine repressor [Clostridia bacterium]|nr:arginine repressor [Clostridia bacterium]